MIRHQMNNPDSQLTVMLQEEIRHTQSLFEFLEIESEALVARDTPALEKVTADKLEHIHLLESMGQQRVALLADTDGDPLIENKQLSMLWQELLLLAEKCQNKNRINGGIIEVGFRQSQQALDILQGSSSKPELYDNSGQATKSTNSGSLAQV